MITCIIFLMEWNYSTLVQCYKVKEGKLPSAIILMNSVETCQFYLHFSTFSSCIIVIRFSDCIRVMIRFLSQGLAQYRARFGRLGWLRPSTMMLSLGSFVHRTGYYAPVSNNKLPTTMTRLECFSPVERSATRSFGPCRCCTNAFVNSFATEAD